MEKITKVYSNEIKSLNEEDKTVVGIISSKGLDRDNDIILSSGIDDKNYSSNPIVLFNHNYNFPIGKSLWRKVEGDNYISKTQFGSTVLAQEVFSLMKDGILNAFSVGFMPTIEPTFEKGVRTFSAIELLEYSVVSIPANPEAITLSFVKGLESPELTSIYFKDYIIENIQKEIDDLKLFKQSYEENIIELKDNQSKLNKSIEDIIAGTNIVKTIKEAKVTKEDVQMLLEKKLGYKIK